MLFWLKFLILALWMMATAFVTFVIGLLRLPFQGKQPSTGVLFGRSFAWGAEFITGIRIHARGRENLLPAGSPAIYCANHQSMFDVVPCGVVYPPGCVIIGKREVKWIPVFGWLFWVTGNIFLDRKNRSRAFNSLDQVVDRVQKDRVSVWIFPEGTRNRSGVGLLPFKRGPFYLAQKTQSPVVPIVISSFKDCVDPTRKLLGPGEVRMQICPAIPPPSRTEDLGAYSDKVRKIMIEALAALSVLVGLFGAGCARAPKALPREGLALDNKPYAVNQILGGVQWIRVRRPAAESADPKAGPGGSDYRATPAPDERLDCQSLETLLQPVVSDALVSCLQTLNTQFGAEGAEAREFGYRLVRETQPKLELQDADEAPECLKTVLPSIPVPREIFFMVRDRQDRLACLSSRVPMDAGDFLGVRLPAKGVEVRLKFPDPNLPKDRAAAGRWLQAWVMTPYFYFEQDHKIQGKYVPESICGQCFGDRMILEKRTDLIPHWP